MTKNWEATIRYITYYYDTVEDLKAHMLYMKRKGYRVWEYDIDEDGTWAEYETNDNVSGSINIEDETDIDFIYE